MNDDIVWIKNPLDFVYLRETRYMTCGYKVPLKRKIWQDQKEIIGYQLVEKSGQVNTFRVWWLKKHDRDIDPNGVYKNSWPCEAVSPSSISKDHKSIPFREYHDD